MNTSMFLNAAAIETFRYYERLGLTENMVRAELDRSRDTVASKSVVRIAATRNFIPITAKEN